MSRAAPSHHAFPEGPMPSDSLDQRTPAECAHCGLPTNTSAQPAFCCHGCRGAYELIHGWGLDAFYDLRDPSHVNPSNPTSDDSFLVFDDEEYLGNSAPQTQTDGLLQTELTVMGLHCAACAWLIESVAARTPGWKSTRVHMHNHTLKLVFDAEKIQLSEIAGLLHRLGYELLPKHATEDSSYLLQNRKLLIQIAIAGFCAVNAMWIAVALYAGDATGLAQSHRTFLRWIGTGLGVTAVAFPGRTFFIGAAASLRSRTPHMDLPVALGLLVGSAAGLLSILLGHGEIYFDSLAVLVFLLLIGRWVQFRQQHRAAQSVDLMLRVTPRHALRVDSDGQCSTVLSERLQVDDIVRVPAGESFPADGIIVRGTSLLDRSLLTGESRPVRCTVGEEVEAGVVNVQSEIDMRVTETGKDSRIGRVMQLVEEASSARTPIVQLADRIGGVFVIVVTALAIATFTWWLQFDWRSAASNATALLIVACPCALALATPLAIAVTLAKSARRKIFIRDGSAIGRLTKRGILWFDKTGTLTHGRPRAVLAYGDTEAIGMAAGIEATCHHPIADAICAEAERRELDRFLEPHGVEVGVGGILGVLGDRHVFIGNQDFMEQHNIVMDSDFDAAVQACLANDRSPVIIAVDGVAMTVMAVEDSLRPDAANTIESLRRSGWQVGILSGDHTKIVTRVGSKLGIPVELCHGELSPEEKLNMIRSKPAGMTTTVMVGDGANDAAALAAADVGIAVRGGAEVSLRAAPVFIASGRLSSIDSLFAAAKRSTRLIHFAMATSLLYNVIAVLLAMGGHISPLVAAILMPISSVTVLSLCLAWPIYSGISSLATSKHVQNSDPGPGDQDSGPDPMGRSTKECVV